MYYGLIRLQLMIVKLVIENDFIEKKHIYYASVFILE